jgi:hypothetical protein
MECGAGLANKPNDAEWVGCLINSWVGPTKQLHPTQLTYSIHIHKTAPSHPTHIQYDHNYLQHNYNPLHPVPQQPNLLTTPIISFYSQLYITQLNPLLSTQTQF